MALRMTVSEKVGSVVNAMTLAELHELNRMVISRIKVLWSCENAMASSQWTLAQRVSFRGKTGAEICGIIIKINRSRATIKSDISQSLWSVPFTMLKAL